MPAGVRCPRGWRCLRVAGTLLPRDYGQNRVAPFTHLGTAGTHAPDWILVRHDQAVGRVLILTHMTSETYLTKSLRADQDGSLEEA